MKDNMAKIYAAFRSGCLGNNILEAYFPFFANIICEENWETVDEVKVAEKFDSKYKIPIPLTFVRQVLGVGIEKGSISYNRGKYIVNREIISKFRFNSEDFDLEWDSMKESFLGYCVSNNYDISGFDIDTRILKAIEKNDDNLLSNEIFNAPDNYDEFDYAWSKYLSNISLNSPSSFNFVASLSFSNIIKQAVFFSGDGRKSFTGLNVYLDSPMVFALLGMDSDPRMSSCKYLVEKMQSSGCCVQIFDHNLLEIEGILSRASGWAVSSQYDILKANNAVRYFHDNQMNENDIAEFCETLEAKFAQLNITIKKTTYDNYSDTFQEDEKLIYDMIESKYKDKHQLINDEKKRSILIDVRSIIMVYRERKGQTATRIQASSDIMLTLNGTIANVSKEYESNRSIKAGFIPACVSADLFGTVLWLFSPAYLIEYQRKQLLADCYLALRPSKKLLDKYVESLENAHNVGDIDEKTFLFMRSHALVNDALMNITKGDYARFNEKTYIEVYEEIQQIAEKKYKDEAEAHTRTKEALVSLRMENQENKQTMKRYGNDIESLKDQMKERDANDFNGKLKLRGWILTISIFGLPYIILMAIIENLKGYFHDLEFYSIISLVGLIILSLILAKFFQYGKKKCFDIVENHLRKSVVD